MNVYCFNFNTYIDDIQNAGNKSQQCLTHGMCSVLAGGIDDNVVNMANRRKMWMMSSSNLNQ